MRDVGTAWRRSGHVRFACTERHPPDGNIAVQAACKAKAGMRDLYRDTTHDDAASAKIPDEGERIAAGNRLRSRFFPPVADIHGRRGRQAQA